MAISIKKDTLLRRSDDSLAADISDREIVILSPDRANYFGTNEVSARIWKLLESYTTAEAITLKLVEEYDVAEDECLTAVIAVLEEMFNEQLVQVSA
jgi:hypothetical protein